MEKKLYVAGMSCENCENKVNAAVSAVSGVLSCKANAIKAQVLVDYDETIAGIDDAITAAITGCGFEVR
ncbi:MAG: heavy-metal-associated domain-containing protein [Bacteroides sp.]|nr:heavy-metal-associated domain-containing protein [Prevotella sp.]MCM1408207.1 heavy-metal-associated domain-containing protein [Treponema brennaborense]MCM1469531.1 heavy-metal-associated domain-containing protein [Bacteroides sp.]